MITEIRGRADWRGGEIAGRPDWRITLRDADRAELRGAVDKVAGMDLADISAADFPLPAFGSVLAGLAGELIDGRGFGLLRGIPVEGLTERQCEILAVGIGSHVGRVMPQPAGVPMLHVRDQGVDPAEPTSRSFQHRGRLDFHSDPTDVVALLCIRPAESGGLSSVVSSVAVHNEMVRAHPDLADVLYQPWWRDRRNGNGPDSFYASPVYAVDGQGRLVANYGADYIRSAQRGTEVPRLTRPQLAAMAELDRLNNDPRLVLAMDLHAGDMQFLNNHVTMHSRTEYRDHADPALRRDLIRLWLDSC
ncbi:MAG TPA: TauD/TfdA family dioxygenase [Pseudonocardiaceae bacterium]|jgi:hypothetical protein